MALDRLTPPEIKQFGDLSVPSARVLTLDNGIKLTVVDQGEQEVNRLTISWEGGANDVDSLSTLKLASDLMREGTVSHSGAEIAETLDYNGSWLKCCYNSHFTSQVIHSLNSRVEEVFPTMVEIISQPTFPTKEFEVLRDKMASRKQVEMERVTYYANRDSHQLLYGENHPTSVDETPDMIRTITREDVAKMHADLTATSTCELFLAGRITPQIEDMVNRTFGAIKNNSNGLAQRVVPMRPSGKRKIVTARPGALQSAVVMAIPTIMRSHPDYIELRLAVMALGGYFGSRLMSNIREDKGYTYGISASLLGNWEGSAITINSQCDNRYVEPLIGETRKEISRLASELMEADELERMRQFAMTSLAATLDSPFSIMDYYENMRVVQTPHDYFARQLQAIKSLSPQRIAYLAEKYMLLDEMRIAVAGDLAE